MIECNHFWVGGGSAIARRVHCRDCGTPHPDNFPACNREASRTIVFDDETNLAPSILKAYDDYFTARETANKKPLCFDEWKKAGQPEN